MVALVIEVRFLCDRYHGVPEWPPAPGRLFQALVAGATCGSKRRAETDDALRWLERQAAPVILAPSAEEGRAFTTYVPNNDGDAEEDPTEPQRIAKTVRAHLLPENTVVAYIWTGLYEVPHGMAAVAAGLFQLGRGIDPAFALARVIDDTMADGLIASTPHMVLRPTRRGASTMDCPMAGTLDSLDARFHAFRHRLVATGRGRAARVAFANPPRAQFDRIAYNAPSRILVFELRDEAGDFRAIDPSRAGILIPSWTEDAAERLGPALAPLAERFVIGRGAGPKDVHRRIRAFVIPTIRQYGDRAIRRLGVVVPPDCPLPIGDLAWAFSGSDVFAARWGRPVPTDDRSMLEAYRRPARLWQSETPLALTTARMEQGRTNRKTGTGRAAQELAARAAVTTALRHAGFGTPVTTIAVRREPFAENGTRAEDFAQGTRFSRHDLWHAEIGFAEPVEGPLLLGNGRFAGLGLMRPVRAAAFDDVLAFRIVAGLAEARAEDIARAFRRAVLSLTGDGASSTISGHAEDGAPLRRGTSTHVAFVADLPRARLLIVPPHRIDHSDRADAAWRTVLSKLRIDTGSLRGLRAGPCGLLGLTPAIVLPDDPLFAPACLWESVTPYRVTRHPKAVPVETALVEDVQRELGRRNLPRADVTIVDLRVGMAGGVSARLRLAFAAAVEGPILLGQTRQKGGGLFAAATGTGG